MTPPELTITTEQVNSLPLLLGLIVDMGIRELFNTHIQAHGNWEGASAGTVLISAALADPKEQAVALRWALRGLGVQRAIRKVRVDAEIATRTRR